MPKLTPRLVRAWLDSLSSGIAEFDRDGAPDAPPALDLGSGGTSVAELKPAPGLVVGRACGYLAEPNGDISFILPLEHGCEVDSARDRVYVGGDFNGWQQAVGKEEWRLLPAELNGERVLRWTGPAGKVYWPTVQRFKFVTAENIWLGLPDDASNAARDGAGNVNRLLDPTRSGRHLWRFALAQPVDLAERWSLGAGPDRVPLVPGRFLYDLGTDLPLGAIPADVGTVFRLFAPRAGKVTLYVCADLAAQDKARAFELGRRPDRPRPWSGK